MQGGSRDVVLYAIAIDPQQPISMSLSPTVEGAAEVAVQEILAELRNGQPLSQACSVSIC
jgi:Ni,Fe-hydrogenase maturation factor